MRVVVCVGRGTWLPGDERPASSALVSIFGKTIRKAVYGTAYCVYFANTLWTKLVAQ